MRISFPYFIKQVKFIIAFLFLTSNSLTAQSLQYVQGASTQSGPVEIRFGFFMMPTLQGCDSLQCTCSYFGMYGVEILNSSVTDTVKIISQNYFQMNTVLNTSNSSDYIAFQDPGVAQTDYLGNYMMFSTINKIICGGDTLLVDPINYYTGYNTPPCTYSTVAGYVFIDANNNCTYDSGESTVSNPVNADAQYLQGNRTYNEYAYNGSFGNSYFNSDGFITADFYLNSYYNFAFGIPACSSPYISVNSLPASNIQIPLVCNSDIDLFVSGYSFRVRPLVPFHYYPSVANIGCTPVSGTLKLVLDPNVTYNAANSGNPANSISGDTLIWNFSNLTNVSGNGYWNSMIGNIELTPSLALNIGDTIHMLLITDVPSNDAHPGNNVAHINLPIVNSYDPNIKEVEPAGIGTLGLVPLGTQKFTYTVHFQNTGNDVALNIKIIDTLDSDLNINSFRILNTSHNLSPKWLSNSVVEFDFNGINLPDSTSNEPLSHGYVTYEIEVEGSPAVGTTIENTAYIYFDYNAPIITNTALNTFEDYNLGLNSYVENNGLLVAPNPMTESTTFKLTNATSEDIELTLTDMTGKVVMRKTASQTNTITISRDNLKDGMYIYTLSTGNSQNPHVGRIVIQ